MVQVTLRSMAGDSCMLDPVTRRLPLTMTIAMVKQLLHRLYKCEPHVQRLSFRESSGAYPALMDDDTKTLGYYAAGDAGEVLMEAVDPAEAARQAAEAERAKEGEGGWRLCACDALALASPTRVLRVRLCLPLVHRLQSASRSRRQRQSCGARRQRCQWPRTARRRWRRRCWTCSLAWPGRQGRRHAASGAGCACRGSNEPVLACRSTCD